MRAQLDDPGSLLHFVRDLVQLRREVPALRPSASREVLAAGAPFVYLRGGTHLVVINPRREPVSIRPDRLAGSGRMLLGAGVRFLDGTIEADGFAHAVLALEEE